MKNVSFNSMFYNTISPDIFDQVFSTTWSHLNTVIHSYIGKLSSSSPPSPSTGYCQSHFGGLCQFLITGSLYSTNSSTLEILGPEYLQIHAPTCCFKETNTIQPEHYLHPIFGRLHFFKKLENLFGLKISKKNVWAGVIRYSFAPLKL